MTYAPTAEQFLTSYQPAEDDETVLGALDAHDPLASMAESLHTIAAALAGGTPVLGELVEAGPTSGSSALDDIVRELKEQHQALTEEHADLEDQHRALYALLADVEKVVAPSTSKLANAVRAAITAWRNPEVPAEPAGPVDEAGEPLEHPAHDAPLEEWQAYALACGATEADLAGANRSRIRTLLGIPQPVEPPADPE